MIKFYNKSTGMRQGIQLCSQHIGNALFVIRFYFYYATASVIPQGIFINLCTIILYFLSRITNQPIFSVWSFSVHKPEAKTFIAALKIIRWPGEGDIDLFSS